MSVSSLHFFWICYFCRIQFINRGFRVPFRNCTKLTLSGESGSMESPATTSSWSALCTSRRAAGCPSYSSIADYTKLTPEFHMTGNQYRLPRSSDKDFCTFKSIYVDSLWASVPLYHYCTCARSWASYINRTQSDHLAIQTTTHGYAIYPRASALRASSIPFLCPTKQIAPLHKPLYLPHVFLFNRLGIRYILIRLSSLQLLVQ